MPIGSYVPSARAARRAARAARSFASAMRRSLARIAVGTCAAICIASHSGAARSDSEQLRVGSKRFTESYILGEILSEAARRAGARAEHRPGLGSTAITFAALQSGSIDVYVEYTGTLARDILRLDGAADLAALDRLLEPMGLGAGSPLGFNNTYALAMRERDAERLSIRRISDLAAHPQLRLGFTQEFLALDIGWPGLRRDYALPQTAPVGIEHGLAYDALAEGRIDVKEVYTTDAKIARYGLRVLEDDRQFFPRYEAVLIYRRDLPQRAPRTWQALAALEGRIDEATMRTLNARVELDGERFSRAAASFFDSSERTRGATARPGWLARLLGPDLIPLTVQHLALVAGSVAGATLVGVPLGVLAFRRPRLGRWVLGAAGVLQTIPSLAMLALLIAAFGAIGARPALAALFLYALLPIVQNTCVGLAAIGTGQRKAGAAIGLTPFAVLRHIELPQAASAIIAGVRTSAVLNVGTATIAAFVGAGGYGERIVQGLALNDPGLLVAGAVPSAVLALVLQWGFDVLERSRARHRQGH